MPQLIRPLTDVSKGAAQVFDISGIADLQRQKDSKMNADFEKLMANSLKYDPNGLYQKDIPIYGDMVKEYQEWVGKNTEALVNPGENINIYQEKLERENRIKNYVALSKKRNAEVDVSTKMSLNDPKYINTQNLERVSNIGAMTQDDFDAGNADIDISTSLNRNYTDILKPWQYAKILEEQLGTVIKNENPGSIVDSDYVKGIMLGTNTEVQLDREQAKKAVSGLFDSKTPEGRDLIHKYRNSDDPEGEFVDDILDWFQANKGQTTDFVKSSGSNKAVKGAFAAQRQLGSSQTLTESGISAPKTPEEIKEARKQGKTFIDIGETYSAGLATVNRGYTTGDDKSKAGTDKGLVVRVDGMGLSIDMPPTGATDVTTGKKLTGESSQVYKSNNITEFGNYWFALKDLDIPIIDEKGKKVSSITIEEGSPLPDLNQLLNEKKITQNTKDQILDKSKGNIYTAIGMVMISDPEPTTIFGMVDNGDYAGTVKKSQSGKIYTVMEVAGHEAAINSALASKYPDLAEKYEGNPLGGILQPITLDNSYYTFWKKPESALRK